MISEILGLFVDTMTANENYSLRNTENLKQPLQMHVWNLHQILNILKKKMNLISDVFPKLEISKNVVS